MIDALCFCVRSIRGAVDRQHALHDVRPGRAPAGAARVARLLPRRRRHRVPGGRVRPQAPARVQGRAGLAADGRDAQQLSCAHPRQQDRQARRRQRGRAAPVLQPLPADYRQGELKVDMLTTLHVHVGHGSPFRIRCPQPSGGWQTELMDGGLKTSSS